MSMEIVNGYVCRNCTDVELAKRGVDPAKPKDDPKSPAYDPAQAKADKHGPAFQLSGTLAGSGVAGIEHRSALPPVNRRDGAVRGEGDRGDRVAGGWSAPESERGQFIRIRIIGVEGGQGAVQVNCPGAAL